jgi:DNA-binding transcriptional MocR family regulator
MSAPLPTREQVQEVAARTQFWLAPGVEDDVLSHWPGSPRPLLVTWRGTVHGPVALGWRWL